MGPLLEVRDLAKEFKGRKVLEGLNVIIHGGDILPVVGPSGSGKTTFLRMLNRLTEPYSGEILYKGESIFRMDPTRLRKDVGMVFQQPPRFDGTVYDNVVFGPKIAGEKELDKIARDTIGKVGLEEQILEKDAKNISVGEMQRVAIARAVANGPRILLMDEPTSALDRDSSTVIEKLIMKLNRQEGITIIIVTHNISQAKRLGVKVLEIKAGSGKMKDIDEIGGWEDGS